MASTARRTAGVLPHGTGTIGVWVAISGVFTYLFLALTGRALGAHEAAGLSTLWVSGFLLGNAAGLPVEQEVSRAIASRRAQGLAVAPVIRRAAIAASGFSIAVTVGVVVAGPVLERELFGGNRVLLIAFVVLFLSTMAEFLVRGVLAGRGQFSAYGRLLGVEAASRVVAVGALAWLGVDSAGPFAIVLAVAPLIGIAGALIPLPPAGETPGGEPAPWGELTRSLGWLFAASVAAQALINLGPMLVRLLAPNSDVLTSAFVATLIVARVPVFLFQAAQAALLPRLSHHAGEGRATTIAAETRALAIGLGVLTVLATFGAALLGPTVVEIGWGSGFALRPGDFAVLAAGSCLYLLAQTFSSALIALEYPNRVCWGFWVGVVVFVGCVAVDGDVLTRIEVGFLAGAGLAAATLAILLRGPLRYAGTQNPVPIRS